MKRRRLGQHFLAHDPTARRIAAASGAGPDDVVLEIGPGRGALTGHLLDTGARIVALELDEALAALVRASFVSDRLTVVRGDALTADFGALLGGGPPAVLVGNLPYRITGSLLERILDSGALWKRAVVMVQREVGLRLTADPGGRDYGVLSIAAALRARRERLFDVPPSRFRPPPKVTSSVVRLDFEAALCAEVLDERAFFRVVRAAFQQRRKKVRNGLAALLGRQEADAVLARGGIPPSARPEDLGVSEFNRIARLIEGREGCADVPTP